MRISDWSSDVCSSDLDLDPLAVFQPFGRDRIGGFPVHHRDKVGNQRPYRAIFAGDKIFVLKLYLHAAVAAEPVDDHPANGKAAARFAFPIDDRSEEHTSELQSLMRISYAVFCFKKKNTT